MPDLQHRRMQMVETHLAARGISDPLVLQAFRDVPREAYVPKRLVEFAYADAPLPIGDEQTISQPYIVAVTVEALELRGGERVLEVGTGSGYAAAILSRIARDVYTVERLDSLAFTARERLLELGTVTKTVGACRARGGPGIHGQCHLKAGGGEPPLTHLRRR